MMEKSEFLALAPCLNEVLSIHLAGVIMKNATMSLRE
jgi:hypothetical protein